MRYGDEIRRARKAKGLTMAEAAKLAGVSPRYYADLEKNVANVSLELLLRVVRALGIRELSFGDVDAHFGGAGVAHQIARKVNDAGVLLAEVTNVLRASGALSEPNPATDLGDVGPQVVDAREAARFTGPLHERELAARSMASLSTAQIVPEPLFRAGDFSYPTVIYGSVYRAKVVGTSMEPVLAPGDVIHIDCGVRTPHPGLLMAAHSALLGSILGRVPASGDLVLIRPHGDPVLLGTGTCVILGAVEKIA